MPDHTSPLVRSGAARRLALQRMAVAAAGIGCGIPAFALGRTLRIGSTLDNSSVEKANGSGLHLGATAYFGALNKAGGVNGASVELVLADDQFKPDVAKANALAFEADRSILGLLHPLGTRQTAAVMDAAPTLALVGPYTGTIGLRKKAAPNTFWVRANYDQEVDKLVATAVALGTNRIGLVHPNDPFGQSLLAAFQASTAKFKLTPAVIATTPNTTSAEVDPAAEQVAKAAPQVVIMGLAGTAPLFVRALRKAGGSSTVYGLSVTASAGNIRDLGELSRGLGFSIVVPTPFASKYEVVRRYQADMKASGNADFSLSSLEGYINARVMAEGLRRAGASPSREALLAGLETIDALDLGGLRIGFGKGRHEGSNFVDVAVIGQGGRMIS